MKVIDELNSTWNVLFPTAPPPTSRKWALWITLYGQTTVRQGVARLALRSERSNDLQTPESLYKFASAIMGKLGNRNDNLKEN